MNTELSPEITRTQKDMARLQMITDSQTLEFSEHGRNGDK